MEDIERIQYEALERLIRIFGDQFLSKEQAELYYELYYKFN